MTRAAAILAALALAGCATVIKGTDASGHPYEARVSPLHRATIPPLVVETSPVAADAAVKIATATSEGLARYAIDRAAAAGN